MSDNFKKRRPMTGRQRYLRYNDVFMTKQTTKPRDFNESSEWEEGSPEYEPQDYNETVIQDDPMQYEQGNNYSDNRDHQPNSEYTQTRNGANYFTGRNSIINDQMIRYQRRQLPPLQRYSPNSHKDAYAEFCQSYWDEDNRRTPRQRISSIGAIWQKFIVTFASILSLVCLSWIAYNWNNNKSQQAPLNAEGIPVIEPERSNFKVLPDNPGGAEIDYRDKTVYSRIDNGASQIKNEERLLPPQEETFAIPRQQQQDNVEKKPKEQNEIEEYSIVSDKIYYIKLSAGKDKQILTNEAKLLKKKYAALFEGKECVVKKVSNSKGEMQRAILVGPFATQKAAIEAGEQCYVISVRE